MYKSIYKLELDSNTKARKIITDIVSSNNELLNTFYTFLFRYREIWHNGGLNTQYPTTYTCS